MRCLIRTTVVSSLVGAALVLSATQSFAAPHKRHNTDVAPQAQSSGGDRDGRYTATYSRYMPMDPKDDHVDKAFHDEFYGTSKPDYTFYHGMGTMSVP